MTQRAPAGTASEVTAFPPYGGMVADSDRASRWLAATRVERVRCTEWVCAPEWRVGERRVGDVMWFCFIEGECEAYVGDRSERVRCRPGDLLMIPHGTPHAVRPLGGAACRMATAHFFARLYGAVDVTALIGLCGRFSGAGAPFTRVNSAMARAFALQPPGWRRTLEHGVWEVLLHLVRNADPKPERAGGAMARGLVRLQPALNLIEARFHDPALSVPELSNAVQVSPVYLRRLFRAALGVSPVAFVRGRRIEEACALLRGTELPVKEIAWRCGFGDVPYFHRAFRTVAGTTPKRFRQRSDM